MSSEILGTWNLVHIYKNNKDLLGNDKDKNFYLFRSMFIESREIDQLTLEIDRDKNIYADFKIKGNTISLTRSTDSMYNGVYSIVLKDTVSEFFQSEVQSLMLSHLDKNLIIYGLIPKKNP